MVNSDVRMAKRELKVGDMGDLKGSASNSTPCAPFGASVSTNPAHLYWVSAADDHHHFAVTKGRTRPRVPTNIATPARCATRCLVGLTPTAGRAQLEDVDW